MKQYYFICIFLCGCCTIDAQPIQEADSLFAAGAYKEAALKYERLVFEAEVPGLRWRYLLRKAYCYKALEDFPRSLAVLDRISISPRDSLAPTVAYERVLVNYLNEDYQQSYNEGLLAKLIQDSLTNDFLVLEFLNLIELNRWEEAKILIQSEESFGLSKLDIEEILPAKLVPKNPSKAYTLSIFLPGVGQMYSGYFFKGLFSAAVQTGLVGFSAFSLYQGYFFTGGMTGIALFYTFYLGGARHAKNLAMKRNEIENQKINQRFLERLK